MYYKFKFEINGEIVDQTNEEISKLVTTMLLNLYEKYKDVEEVFSKQ